MRISYRQVAASVVAAAVATLAAMALTVASADADAFGQITAWGSPGSGAGELYRPTELGVDPTDNSVYVVDQNTAGDAYRLQKFSSSGALVASATIPRVADGSGNPPLLLGVAVDPGLHRLYLLQYRIGARPALPSVTAAEQILVFSTQDSGGTLSAPADVPSGVLSVPDPTGSDAILLPRGLAVDPTTHNLLVLGFDPSAKITVQSISSAGVAGARFDDSTPSVLANGPYFSLAGIAIAPDGSVYVAEGDVTTTVWVDKLPSTLDSVTSVLAGGAGPAITENWNLFGGTPPQSIGLDAAGLGDQLALSADGNTLFWTERVSSDSAQTPGSYSVRGFSLATGATSVLYGGGTGGICEVTGHGASLAPGSGGVLYVLDHGNYDTTPPTFGAKVIEFGPGGSGCPAPVAAFTVGGSSDSEVTVQKGSTVTFDASGSQLHGATPSELDWDFDGSGTFATHVTGSPASTSTTHKYLQVGTFDVGLKMMVTGSSFGNPPMIEKTVHVLPGTPTAAFSPSTSSPTAGATVTFDASQSVDPTGSAQAGPTHTLKTYTWSFGDGSAPQQTSTATVQHTFANAAATAVARTVTLTVRSNDDVDSAPVSHQITVAGTPVQTGPPVTTPHVTPLVIIPPGIAKLMSGKLTDVSTAGLTIGCAVTPAACAGTVTLTTTVKVKPKHAKKAKSEIVVVGSAKFGLAAGEHRTIKVKLSSKAKALLRTAHKLKLTLKIVTHNSTGATVSSTKTLTLTAPKPKPKKRKR